MLLLRSVKCMKSTVLILYNARQFEKMRWNFVLESLLNTVIKWEKYDDFALEWYSTIVNTPIITKLFLA